MGGCPCRCPWPLPPPSARARGLETPVVIRGLAVAVLQTARLRDRLVMAMAAAEELEEIARREGPLWLRCRGSYSLQ